MRLTCPNCGAQYEVPDGVIPAAGRDVQCSNCGHTWLQTPTAAGGPAPRPDTGAQTPTEESARDPEPGPQAADASPQHPEAGAPPAPADADANSRASAPMSGDGDPADTAPDSGTHAASRPDAVPEDGPAPHDDEGLADAAEHDAAPRRRRLDPEVAEVLRTEAEREQRAREAEAEPLETQPDLGLDGAVAQDPGEARAATGPVSRREMLPDIEDIKSNLRGEAEPLEEEAPATTPGPGGNFARGVALALLLGSLLIALYAYAGALAEEVPALAPALAAYVGTVETARVWAHETVTAVLLWLERLGAA